MKKIKNSKVLKFLSASIKVILGILITLILAIIIIQRVFNNNASLFGYRIFTVASGSMEPRYKILDMLLVKDTDAKEIALGDDLVYLGKEGTYAGKVITHEVIKIEEKDGKKYFTTKGIIEMAMEDPLVSEDQIYGKVLGRIPLLSGISRIMNNQIGFFFLIVVPMAFLILLEIIDIKNRREELALENEKE